MKTQYALIDDEVSTLRILSHFYDSIEELKVEVLPFVEKLSRNRKLLIARLQVVESYAP